MDSKNLLEKIDFIKNFQFPQNAAGMVNTNDEIKNKLIEIKEEIIDSEELDDETKKEYLKVLYNTDLINESIEESIVDIVFEENEEKSISEKISLIRDVVGSEHKYIPEHFEEDKYNIVDDCFNRVYNVLVERGKVAAEDTVKRQVLEENFINLEYIENIEQILDGLTYASIGEIYKLQYNGELNFELTKKYFSDAGISRINQIKRTIDENGEEKYTCFPRLKREVLPLVKPEIEKSLYEVNDIFEVDRKVIVLSGIDKIDDKELIVTKNYLIDENKNLVEVEKSKEESFIISKEQEYADVETKKSFERKSHIQLENALGNERIADGILNANLAYLTIQNGIEEKSI